MADDDIDLFRRAMADAKPLKAENRAATTVREPVAKTRPGHRQRSVAPAARAFAAATIDDNDDDHNLSMRYQRPSIGRRVMRKLARGGYRVDDAMDLHGMTVAEAAPRLEDFLNSCVARDFECVRIVHGKGLGSGDRGPVLKRSVNRWLRQYAAVDAFVPATQSDGGSGAVYVLLRGRT